MKTIIFLLSFLGLATISYAQKQLISYEDMKYILENNLGKTDTFLVAKGYNITKVNTKKNTREYAAALKGGTKSDVNVRADGKKIYMEIQTNDISQYNMIYNSVAEFVVKDGGSPDLQVYNVKELGTIYIQVADSVPYNPIRKDYDIHLVADKHITSYN